MEGDDPVTVETRRVRELLQTALAQQENYSYSRDKIHPTPPPWLAPLRQNQSPSYSRHMVAATGQVMSDAMTCHLATARLITEPFTQQTKTEHDKRRSRCLS